MDTIESRHHMQAISTRRRLQNREAQRRYREKAAKKKRGNALEWASLSLQELDWDAALDHGDIAIGADVNWEQDRTTSSSFSPPDGIPSTEDDASLMLDVEMMRPQCGNGDIHAQTQYPIPGRNQQQHPLMSLYQPSFTGNYNSASFDQAMTAETTRPLEPVQPLLHAAVRSRKSNMVAMLLQHGAAAVGDRNGDGVTALHVATELGDETMVSVLLRYGADSSVRDVRGQDALHLAVSAGHTVLVKMMLDKRNMTSEYFTKESLDE